MLLDNLTFAACYICQHALQQEKTHSFNQLLLFLSSSLGLEKSPPVIKCRMLISHRLKIDKNAHKGVV